MMSDKERCERLTAFVYLLTRDLVIFTGFCAGNVATFLGDKYCS